MGVNFIVEDFKQLKYVGCSTLARELYNNLNMEKGWNSKNPKFDVNHFHTFGPWAWLMLKRAKNKTILTAHSTPKGNTGNVMLGEKFWRPIYREIYNKFDYLIAVSETCKKELEDMGIKKDIYVIHNGVNREKFRFSREKRKNLRKKYKFRDKDFVVLNVAQQTSGKGIFDFISLSKTIKNAKFVWVGGQPYSKISKNYRKVKKEVNDNHSNLIFPGQVDNIVDFYCAADLFLNTSNYETFGLTVAEAMSCGLPVIMKNLSTFKELFSENGNLCKSIEEMKERVKEFKQNENLRKKYSKKSLKAAGKFDINKIAKQHEKLYERLT